MHFMTGESEPMVDKSPLIDAMATVLGDSIVFLYKLQGAHWNVVGPDFHQYHSGFFSMIYEDVEDAIDPAAENIRKLGAFAPSRLQDFARLSNISDDEFTGFYPKDLLQDLYYANEILIKDIERAFALADGLNEQGVADFLAGRDDMHKKWRWQIESSLRAD